MHFYTGQHQFYCAIDLHARLLAVCVLDQTGNVVCQTQIPADKQRLLDTLAPFRPDVDVAVECLFAWYWNGKGERKRGQVRERKRGQVRFWNGKGVRLGFDRTVSLENLPMNSLPMNSLCRRPIYSSFSSA
jgi:hypothetical protein